MLALDISSSMKAGDFQPGNRLEVARRVLADFVRRRDGDLMGLVIFAGRAFLQAPLTPDTDLLERLLGQVDIGQLPDGTAIGTALALALGQLKDLPAEASAIVLITDGANNTGRPRPFVAAEAAQALGIRIHAIGLSTPIPRASHDGFVWREGRHGRSAHQLRRARCSSGSPTAPAASTTAPPIPRRWTRILRRSTARAERCPHQRDPRLPRALPLAPVARPAAARRRSRARARPLAGLP